MSVRKYAPWEKVLYADLGLRILSYRFRVRRHPINRPVSVLTIVSSRNSRLNGRAIWRCVRRTRLIYCAATIVTSSDRKAPQRRAEDALSALLVVTSVHDAVRLVFVTVAETARHRRPDVSEG